MNRGRPTCRLAMSDTRATAKLRCDLRKLEAALVMCYVASYGGREAERAQPKALNVVNKVPEYKQQRPKYGTKWSTDTFMFGEMSPSSSGISH